MGKVEQILKAEMSRMAKKESRGLSKDVISEVTRLKREVTDLHRAVARLEANARAGLGPGAPGAASGRGPSGGLIAPEEIRSMRRSLGITQSQLATMVGVSAGAVAFWEQGRSQPRPRYLRALITLRDEGPVTIPGQASRLTAVEALRSDGATSPAASAKPPGSKPRRKKTSKKRTAGKKSASGDSKRKSSRSQSKKQTKKKSRGSSSRKKTAKRAGGKRKRAKKGTRKR